MRLSKKFEMKILLKATKKSRRREGNKEITTVRPYDVFEHLLPHPQSDAWWRDP